MNQKNQALFNKLSKTENELGEAMEQVHEMNVYVIQLQEEQDLIISQRQGYENYISDLKEQLDFQISENEKLSKLAKVQWKNNRKKDDKRFLPHSHKSSNSNFTHSQSNTPLKANPKQSDLVFEFPNTLERFGETARFNFMF